MKEAYSDIATSSCRREAYKNISQRQENIRNLYFSLERSRRRAYVLRRMVRSANRQLYLVVTRLTNAGVCLDDMETTSPDSPYIPHPTQPNSVDKPLTATGYRPVPLRATEENIPISYAKNPYAKDLFPDAMESWGDDANSWTTEQSSVASLLAYPIPSTAPDTYHTPTTASSYST